MSAGAQARTERPTPRRRREARRAGLAASSPVLTGATALGALAITWVWAGGWLWERLTAIMTSGLGGPRVAAFESPAEAVWASVAVVAGPVLTLMLAVMGGALLAGVAQVGPRFTAQPLRPDWGRVGLGAGWRAVWSREAWASRWRALLTGLVVVSIAATALGASLPELARLPGVELDRGVAYVALLVGRWLRWTVLALFALGLADWALARRRQAESLRMTRREVTQERRETEGDPLMRHERARVWRDSTPRIARTVTDAAVVVASAAEAVALFWDPAVVAVPEVLAVASGAEAERLRAAARRLGVRVVEAPTLAKALGRTRAGDAVPEGLFDGLASVLGGVA